MIGKSQYAVETVLLTKIFPDWWGRAKVVAVEELNLRIGYNQIYGLLGPNGSGKTTTLKVLLNLLYPTRGRVFVLGGSAADTHISRRIGYLPEESYLYKYLSARETLDFYGRIFGLSSHVRKQRIDSLLEMVGLTGMANRPVGTFSKGMARRIGLAQALINDPDLLILDEPTSGMDPIGNRQIKDLLKKLVQRGKTILLCSHLLADVEDICDRVGILYGGRMQVEGGVGELLGHSDRRQIVTGPISDGAVEEIKHVVRSENAPIEIGSPMDKLEEYFIRIVTAAQQQKKPTSGAVSTTGVKGFLAEEKVSEGILDKLVSAAVAYEAPDGGDVETRQTEPDGQQTAPSPDRDLLEQLRTTISQPVQTEMVQKAPTPPPTDKTIDQTATDQPTGKSILDQLLGRDKKGDAATNLTDLSQQGDAEDE